MLMKVWINMSPTDIGKHLNSSLDANTDHDGSDVAVLLISCFTGHTD